MHRMVNRGREIASDLHSVGEILMPPTRNLRPNNCMQILP